MGEKAPVLSTDRLVPPGHYFLSNIGQYKFCSISTVLDALGNLGSADMAQQFTLACNIVLCITASLPSLGVFEGSDIDYTEV